MAKAKITHFKSPHLFYFKYDLCDEKSAYLKVLEDAIGLHVAQQKRLHPLAEYHFKIGDLVSLYYLPWERFLRAKVLEVFEKFSSTTDYIVWVHDYGFPVQTDEMSLMPLPDTFKELESLVHRGCLANVTPVYLEDNGKDIKRSTEWNTKIWEKLDLCSENVFVEAIDAIDFRSESFRFYKMELEMADSKRIDVIDLLENLQFGMRVETHAFTKFLNMLTLTDNVDWVKNDGTANFLINGRVGKQSKLPIFLHDCEKQPPLDEKPEDLYAAAKLQENNFLDFPSPNDQKFINFPRNCLAHSTLLLSKRNSEKVFHAEICAQLHRMGITSINVLQRYSWPHLQRGNSLFVISPSGSGKKWCYLPVICNVLQIFASNIRDNSALPLSIVVTENETRSVEIAMICKKILENIKINGKDQLVFIGLDPLNAQIFRYVGILILTKENILNELNDGAFKKLLSEKHLYSIILDNVTDIWQYEDETLLDRFIAFCRSAQQFVEANQRLLQIIVTASKWKEEFLQTVQNTTYPLLLMSDFLEAAIYAKCPIITKVCQDHDKKLSLIASFVQKHQCQRIVVVCSNNNEAMVVDKALNRSGLCAFSYTTREHANKLLQRWQNLISNEVLICTDAELPQLCLHRVHKLVHYSLPVSWSSFNERFSVLKDAYHNFIVSGLKCDENVYRNEQVSSLIALDANDLHLIPQLIQFFKKYNQPVSEKLQNFATKKIIPIRSIVNLSFENGM